MTTVDLITGFLGSGKTTFMKRYVRRLMDKGENVCILENDFGAVNIDTMLLQELYDAGCGMEMVAGACDKDCHQRRFKTKLIAMAMSGYSRVVIEPSGIFDVDEFFDTLREPPLDRWYKMGSVITIVDPFAADELSDNSAYLLASQAAVAGKLVFSHCSGDDDTAVSRSLDRIAAAMKNIRSERDPKTYFLAKPWDTLTDSELDEIASSGCHAADFVKLHNEIKGFESVYFMELSPSPEQLKELASAIMTDKLCGGVFRVKGFTKNGGEWYEVNATHNAAEVKKIAAGQSVIIVIGESLDRAHIGKYFEKL